MTAPLRDGPAGVIVLACGAMLWTACGGGAPPTNAGDGAIAKSAPATAASTPTPNAAPSPDGPKPAAGAADAAQKTAFDPDAEYDKGAALAVARRFAEARQVFEEAARLAPADGSLTAAVAMFGDLAAKRISEDVVQRLFQAGQEANAERWPAAHADVDEAIKLAPGYGRAYGLRGTLFLEQSKPQDALKAFDEVVKLDPRFAEGYYNRGATHAALDQHDAAIADFSRAIELQPTFWDAYANRGLAYQSRGLARQSKQDLTAAMADYTKAHELNPGAVEPLYLRGALYALAEQWTEATADFTQVIALDPAHAGAHYNKGLALEHLGRPKDAVAEYQVLLETAAQDDPLAQQARQRVAAIEKSPED